MPEGLAEAVPTTTSYYFPGGADGKESAHNVGRPRFNPLEKGMATLSSILAWKTPWTEEPGGLQSMRLQQDTTERLNTQQTRDCPGGSDGEESACNAR